MTARAAKWKKYAPFYVMLLLPVTYFLIFRYLPMLGVVISFKDYDFQKGIWASPWATPIFKHFQTFFESPYCWEVLRNTLLEHALFGKVKTKKQKLSIHAGLRRSGSRPNPLSNLKKPAE